MLLAVRISSYGCTWKVRRGLKKVNLLSAAPRATHAFLCSLNLPRASITRYTHAKHEHILNFFIKKWQFNELIFQFSEKSKLRVKCNFPKNLKWNFLNSFFHFPKTKTKQKKENWNAFTNSISLIGDPGDENTPITWCLYLLQACLIKILLSTWSLSQEERENEESKEKLENLRYIQKDLRLCFRWVEYQSFAVFSRDWSSTCNSCLLSSNTVWIPVLI